ncbi:MAG: HAMP domain-containing histidine kinase [Kineosporiaceae bacterium]|nr:HAMP domain-containing histidine kinase [Kineosporiaceae bacterium]
MNRATAEIVLLGLGLSGGVALLGLLVVRLGPRSVRASMIAVSLVAVASMVMGVAGAARAMFISAHDLGVVLPVTAVASLVAVTVSWLLSRRLVEDVDRVRITARSLGGHGDTWAAAPARPTSRASSPRLRELTDIETELLMAREHLIASRVREQALEISRQELIAWVSHDLRTPLAGLRAMAEALEDGVAPDPDRYHRQIRREVDRLSALVDDLFELSRIRSGRMALTLRDIDLQDLVADVVSGSVPMARAGGVILDAAADAAPVRVDAGGMARVLTNLVVNAIRHTPSDGAVQVSGRRHGDEVVLSVSDGCGGIPDDDLSRVFEPGWRGDGVGQARTPRPDGGAGLGLAIARGIVEAHQGRISVRNTSTGCCFDVRLPAASAV